VRAVAERSRATAPDALRVVGTRPPEFDSIPTTCFVNDATPVADGLVEGLRYRREQAVSRTLHRFGNVTEGRQTP
jgi:hypothetical protein